MRGVDCKLELELLFAREGGTRGPEVTLAPELV